MKFKATLLSYKRDDGRRTVAITATHNYKREYIPLKDVFVRKTDWNKKIGRVLQGRDNADQINGKIIDRISQIEAEWLKDRNITLSQLAARVRDKKPGIITLTGFIQDYTEKCKAGKILTKDGHPIKKNTYKGYENLVYRLELFCKYRHDVGFDDIDSKFYSDYVGFLRNGMADAKRAESGDKEREYKNLADNSIGTDIKNLKKMMRLAVKAGLTTNNAWEDFTVIDHEVDTITLDENEISMIEKYKVPDHLQEEKDRFLCSYNFLLRYNDSISFGEGNISEHGGKHFFHTRTTKVGQRVLVPIRDVTWQILKKNNFQIPKPTLQEANWKLKEICRLAGIEQPVTIHEQRDGKVTAKTLPKCQLVSTHTARRSGATNMLLAGIDMRVIMDLGGWDTEDSFKRYIRYDKIISANIAADHRFFK